MRRKRIIYCSMLIISFMLGTLIHKLCAKPKTIEIIKEIVIENACDEVARNEMSVKSLGEFKITAYCHCAKCCNKSDGITASGAKCQEGVTIAVDPNTIPLGTEVIIDNHKYIAQDVGGSIRNNRIDIYFDSHQKALEYGVQHKEVFIIEGGNEI